MVFGMIYFRAARFNNRWGSISVSQERCGVYTFGFDSCIPNPCYLCNFSRPLSTFGIEKNAKNGEMGEIFFLLPFKFFARVRWETELKILSAHLSAITLLSICASVGFMQ